VENKKEAIDFKVCGFAALTADAVARVDMTPVHLLKIGWPNRFLILEVYEDAAQGKLLRLDPCCAWMRDPLDDTKEACKAHPAKHFESLVGHIADQADAEAEAKEGSGAVDDNGKGHRYSGFGRSEGGEDTVGVEFVEDGDKPPSFFFRRAGASPVVLRGEAANKIRTVLGKLGIL